MNPRDIVVTGMPCSGTTITAKVLAQLHRQVVDHVTFPHNVYNGEPVWKVLPEAKVHVVVTRNPKIHVRSLVKNNFAPNLEAAVELHNLGLQRLNTVLDQLDPTTIVRLPYPTLHTQPNFVLNLVAERLGIQAPFNMVELYDGDAPYKSTS